MTSRFGLTPECVIELKKMSNLRRVINRDARALRLGTPAPYDHRVTLRVNALQMFFASRWIVSSHSDFSHQMAMIADSEEFRTRPKVRVE